MGDRAGVADGEIRPDVDVITVRDVFYGGVSRPDGAPL